MHSTTWRQVHKTECLFLQLNTCLHAVTWVLYTDQNTTAFKEVAIIRHPRIGEYAFGFITSTVVLQVF